MDIKLKQDLQRFFRVYESNVLEVLQKRLPPQVGVPLKNELDEEFDLFKTSLMNRLSEEFRY